MQAIRSFHFWAVTLFVLHGLLAFHNFVAASFAYWSVCGFYALGVWLLHRGNVWSTRLLILPPVLIFGFTAPFVVFNFWKFISGDPRYLDSPGTILVVAVVAALTTFPSFLVLVAYWRHRKEVFGR